VTKLDKLQNKKTKNENTTQMSTLLSVPPKTYGKNSTPQKSRYWMLTLNMPKGTDPESLTANDILNIRAFNRACQVNPVTYAVFQPEFETNYHIQGYVELAHPLSLAGVKKHFGLPQLHCEVRAGTQAQAIEYCTKEDTRVEGKKPREFGTKVENADVAVKSGTRSDLHLVYARLKEHVSLLEILEDKPYLIHTFGSLQKVEQAILLEKRRVRKTQLLVFTGDARSGKSSTAIKFAEACGDYFFMPNDGKEMWWDGYDPIRHKTIVLDEFNGSKCRATFLNQLADKFPLRVGVKGGFKPFLAERIIITSNFEPKKWYAFEEPGTNLCWEALEDRIDIHTQFIISDVAEEGPNGKMYFTKMLDIRSVKGGLNMSWISSKFPLRPELRPTPPNSYSEEGPVPLSRANLRTLDGVRALLAKRVTPESSSSIEAEEQAPKRPKKRKARLEVSSDDILPDGSYSSPYSSLSL